MKTIINYIKNGKEVNRKINVLNYLKIDKELFHNDVFSERLKLKDDIEFINIKNNK